MSHINIIFSSLCLSSWFCFIRICSIGRNISFLIDRSDEPHVFRFHKDRVYYVRYFCIPFRSVIIYCLFLVKPSLNAPLTSVVKISLLSVSVSENSQNPANSLCTWLPSITWPSTLNTKYGWKIRLKCRTCTGITSLRPTSTKWPKTLLNIRV